MFVTDKGGEGFIDPMDVARRDVMSSMTQRLAWSPTGASQGRGKTPSRPYRSGTTPTSASTSRIDQLASAPGRRVLVFRNGSGAHGYHVVSVGHGSADTSPEASRTRHLQFLDSATAKLELTIPAWRVYDLSLAEIRDIADAPPVPPDLRCLLGPIAGPVWVTHGEPVSASGPIEFIDRLLAAAHTALGEPYTAASSTSAATGTAHTSALHSAWVPAGVGSTQRRRSTGSGGGGGGGGRGSLGGGDGGGGGGREDGGIDDDEKWVEYKLAVEYLDKTRILAAARKDAIDQAAERAARATARGGTPTSPAESERLARLETLQGDGGVLKFAVVENGREDIPENCVTVLFNARKASARGASPAELLQLLVLQCTEQVKPSRGRGKRLLFRTPRGDGGAYDVRVVANVMQLHNPQWLASQGLDAPPTLFLSCGEPFIEWKCNTLALDLVGADAINTTSGKAQVRALRICTAAPVVVALRICTTAPMLTSS